MSGQKLKLKLASAVLQVEPKELQHLAQFGIVKPRRTEGNVLFRPDHAAGGQGVREPDRHIGPRGHTIRSLRVVRDTDTRNAGY